MLTVNQFMKPCNCLPALISDGKPELLSALHLPGKMYGPLLHIFPQTLFGDGMNIGCLPNTDMKMRTWFSPNHVGMQENQQISVEKAGVHRNTDIHINSPWKCIPDVGDIFQKLRSDCQDGMYQDSMRYKKVLWLLSSDGNTLLTESAIVSSYAKPRRCVWLKLTRRLYPVAPISVPVFWYGSM